MLVTFWCIRFMGACKPTECSLQPNEAYSLPRSLLVIEKSVKNNILLIKKQEIIIWRVTRRNVNTKE